MSKQNYIYIGSLIVLSFLLVSCGENIKEVTFEGEDLELEGAKALERAIDAKNNYHVPDTYKLEFYTYMEIYQKQKMNSGEETNRINDIQLSGYIDRTNERGIVENKIKSVDEGETEERTETIILKDGIKYGIRDGKVIYEYEESWTYRDEIIDVIGFFEGNEEIIEYTIVKESGNSYDVLKLVPSTKALSNMGGNINVNDLELEGLKYESYIEIWVNKKTEQIERAYVFLDMDLDIEFQETKTKLDIRVVRTEIGEKIPISVFDVPD